MIQKMLKGSHYQGFSLIELMIVIAIISILGAIAIPNFIAYRNKSFCSAAEHDANNMASAIANYFATPSRVKTPVTSNSVNHLGVTTSGQGTAQNTWTVVGANPNINITITVTDRSSRCPAAYMNAMDDWNNGVYTKSVKGK